MYFSKGSLNFISYRRKATVLSVYYHGISSGAVSAITCHSHGLLEPTAASLFETKQYRRAPVCGVRACVRLSATAGHYDQFITLKLIPARELTQGEDNISVYRS